MIQNPGKKQVTIMFSSMLKGGRSLMLAFCLLAFCSTAVIAQTETLSTGSYIINMGVVPQTQSNALKPYGLVYDLLKNYNVQVKWVISQSKVKDGADFTYNGVQYKGGTFIIPAQYRTAAVNSRISFFGVTGTTTTSPLTVNVTHTLTKAPKWTLDFQNGDIAAGFFADAGIPTSACDTKTPAQLNGCDEIYVMPHADADWTYYGPLRNWILNFRGSFWGGCRTGSQIENLFNPANPSEQMNFLSNNVGAAGNALVPYDSHADGTPPYIHQSPTSTVAQYMGITDGAHQNGSEQIYLPKLNGSWRPTTQVIAYDSTQSNVPALSPGPASAIVFGRAYGNPLSGLVMYEGGHDIGGTGTQQIAAQRAFWNFSFLSSTEVLPGGCVGSISDFVWNDANGNGLQDNGEPGLQGVQVTLTRPDLTTVTTTTSATGFYQFGGLAVGTYKVTFPTTIAGGFALTNANIGSDDSKDSDPDRATGLVNNIVIGPGQNNPTIDAGYILANLSLGNQVFFDLNRSGLYDAGDSVAAGMTVRLYADNNNDNIADGAFIQTTSTNATGNYTFSSLTPGNYIVGVAVPSPFAITIINGGDPDNNIDNDNNATTLVSGEARGLSISLSSGAEPTAGNTNNTYDIGLYNPILPPNGGQNCFTGTNPLVYAKSYWTVNANTQTVTLRVTFSKKFVDNTYGTGAIGWPNGHTWANLTGSDHLQWSIRDANGVERLAFKQDYVSAGAAFPSGWGCLGFGGDGGTPTVGLASDVLSFRTSIASNFNDFGYVLTTNSPATDTNYIPNPTYPNWIYDVWYEVTVKASVFGGAGFGFVNVASVHASPSKTGNNTEIITNIPCVSSIGDRVWYDTDRDGIQDAGENGIRGVTVKLRNAANTVIATQVTNALGNYLFTGLNAGTYTVEFPATVYGYILSPAYVGTNRFIDSDPSVTTGITPAIVLGVADDIRTIDAGYAPDCACVNSTSNLLINPSFENGTTGWNWSGGTLTTGTGYVACGTKNGFNDWSSGTSRVWQDVTVAAGSTVNFSAFAGTHAPGIACSPRLSLVFLNAANAVISQSDVTVTRVVGDYNDQLAQYSITAVAPAGTVKVRVQSTITCNTMKLDAFCLTVTLPPASIGDRVWFDNDKDGIQDAGENGIAGVTVKLRNAANTIIATQVTNATGNYLFGNLAPGNYTVEFPVIVSVYPLSPAFVGADRNIDSDPNQATGITPVITLVAGQANLSVDAGYFPNCDCVNFSNNLLTNGSFENGTTGWSSNGGTLTTNAVKTACGAFNGVNTWTSGTSKVWQDLPSNAGTFLTFSGYAGTTTAGLSCSPKISLIFLDAINNVISQTDIAVTRNVDITNGLLEQYTFTAVAPAGTRLVRVQSSINCSTLFIDAFCVTTPPPPPPPPLVSLGDRVWNDANNNGIQDAGEIGIAGVTLVLLNNADQPIATTTTDAYGIYKFDGLRSGQYSVRITPPANYSLSQKLQGTDTTKDSDFDQVTYVTRKVTLVFGDYKDLDAGLYFKNVPPASVGDRVWLDTNGDGVQDTGEPGVSNVLVTLYSSTTGMPVRYTYTDVNGYYLFTIVSPGTYTVGVSLPPAFVFSPNNGAISGAANSDIIPATGRTATFTVNLGDQITYVDAGIRSQVSTNGSVGDFVWNDLNQDGLQDAGEPGISGVVVRLLNAATNAVVSTTSSDAAGKYIFNDVAAGNYLVEFVTPSGYTTTSKLNNNVEASATDSDVDPATSRTVSFALAAGQRITTVDAGYWQTNGDAGIIGDRVWLDANQNGIQDFGEKDIQGVTVILYDATNTAIKQTVTDASGNYLFTNLAAGNYSINFSNIPAGFVLTTQGLGTAATGSDANPATGRTATIILAAAQTNLDIDAGIRSAMSGTASIGNRVWNDFNFNGIQNPNEPGIAGITVELLDANGNPIDSDPVTPGIQPTTRITNALGEYLFTGLAAGDYRVRFSTLPAGFTTSPKAVGTNRDIDSDGNTLAAGTSTTDVVSVAAGEERLDIDLGIFNPTAPTGQLGDFVWFDINSNGIQNADEPGIPGVEVILYDLRDSAIARTVTDINGEYRFVNLADGFYYIEFKNLPDGFFLTTQNQGNDDSIDSDPGQFSGTTALYQISGGNINLTVDGGLITTKAALGDYVWFDTNSNGVQEGTEKGIAGITVTLYDANNTAVTSTVTDQNGRYFFSNLNPATYTVGFGTIPTQLVFTIKDAVVAGDLADSDVDPATGKTGPVTLTAGQVNLSVDAGLRPFVPASIGDFVWVDLDRDGIQDPAEPGVPGVIVTLYNAANQPIGSAITDGSGFYQISNVPTGTGYYVVFSNKPDPAAPWTLQNVGGAGANNNSKADATGKTASFNVAEGENITNIDAGLYRIINLSGNVWHDANAMDDNLVNKTGVTPIPVGLRVYLVNFSNGAIIEGVRGISSLTESYLFQNVNVNTNYRVYLTNRAFNVGTVFPGTNFNTLPGTWTNTGEKLGITTGSDGIANGWLNVPVGVSSVINANFGIKEGGGGGQQ